MLELSDRHDNGKTWWVPVSVRKTYWPPPSLTQAVATRQDCSASSVSISDESSSVQSQSSSWQRETRWKNPCPVKKSTSSVQEMFVSVGKSSRERYCRCQWSMRRKPFRLTVQEPCLFRFNSDSSSSRKCLMGQRWRKSKERILKLAIITSQLLEKAHRIRRPPGPVSHEVERNNESLVSPRKRLSALRDLEKVACLQNPTWNALKKAKAIVPPTPLQSHFSHVSVSHSTTAVVANAKAYDRQSSYSIDSLLNSQMQQHHEGSSSSSFLPNNSFFRSSLLSSLLQKSPSYSDGAENKLKVPNFSVQLPSQFPTDDLVLGSSLLVRHPLRLPHRYPGSSGMPLPSSSLPTSSSLTPLTLAVVGRPDSSSSNSQDDVFDMRNILPPFVSPGYEDGIARDTPLNLTINKAKENL